MAASTYAAQGCGHARSSSFRPCRTTAAAKARADFATTSAVSAFLCLCAQIRPCNSLHRNGTARAPTYLQLLNSSRLLAFVPGGKS
jgi:hypothetical protein